MLLIRRVHGGSMLPTLKPGQIVIARRSKHLQTGDVVILEHSGLEKIKRISKLKDGKVYVTGDSPNSSTDSRRFGWLPTEAITAKVIYPRSRTR